MMRLGESGAHAFVQCFLLTKYHFAMGMHLLLQEIMSNIGKEFHFMRFMTQFLEALPWTDDNQVCP